MREQSCSIPRRLKINKNSAEGEVFFVDFPSYRTFQELPKVAFCFTMAYEVLSGIKALSSRSDGNHDAIGILSCYCLFPA
jgi:hypothetical protein